MELKSMYEIKVDKILDKMFGESSSPLKTITKLSMMNKEVTPEVQESLNEIKEMNLEQQKILDEEMECTLDASGNIILLPKLPIN